MVSNRLQQILDVKKTEVARILPRMEHLRNAAMQRNEFRGFAAALERGEGKIGLIAEVKKASPSAGVIATDFDPVAIASAYQLAGAHCVSVLTDEQFFQGHLSDLVKVRASIGLPCLRKDFIVHEVQIYEASVAGADCILLIVAALDQPVLEQLYKTAELCQMDVLVEVHSREEMDRALDLGSKMIGINNRNLTTFAVDMATTEELSEEVPSDVLLVSESGMKSPRDIKRAFDSGCDAVLVGESLMRAGIEGVSKTVSDFLNVSGRADFSQPTER